ncbi:hypothetical protein QA942_19995 [Streptomyces sp. B21-106]|uniref:hypothetical protein n=1 Tax=Streptomyces sp. B21-106 TaxID=3039418 RepID=UPI002FF24980
MTGPEHYREGERLFGLCNGWIDGAEDRGHIATEAQAHFLAALVAVLAEDKFTDSVSWQKAVGW